MERKGIDVSTWQGDIDWKQVVDSGVQFAMVRASFGSDGVDNQFANNMKNAPAAGMPCGAYHYTYATNAQQAKQEAEHFLKVIAPYQFPYPVAYDLEGEDLDALGKQTITDMVLSFCQTVQDAGYYVCLYANLNRLLNYIDLDRVSKFDIWLAQWNDKPTFSGSFGLWQYSSTGQVPGIDGNVDLDIAYQDYPAIIKAAGLNGFDGSSTDPEPSPSPSPSGTYTVKSGDTLSEIAEDYGISLSALLAANPQISDPNLIYPGQVITIPEGGSTPSPAPSPSGTYTVKSGDTLSEIAEDYGVSLSALLAANPQISDPNLIYPGQVITIPEGGASPAPAPSPSTYTVKPGDTLSEIAEDYGVSLSALLAANPQISDPNLIYSGQVITIPS